MSQHLSSAHHQWIREISGGAVDPATYPASPGQATQQDHQAEAGIRTLKTTGDAWMTVESQIRDDIEALRLEVVKDHQGHPDAKAAEEDFKKFSSQIFRTFDGRLQRAADAASHCKSSDDVAKVKTVMSGIMDAYYSFAKSSEVIAHLDRNPFIPMSLAAVCTAKLASLKATIAAVR